MLEKIKILPEKSSYTSGNGTPKRTSYIFSKKSCSYISRNGNPKKLLICQQTEVSYISGRVYSKPWHTQNPNIFRTTSIFRTLVYSEPEAYSKHCETFTMESFSFNIKKSLIFQETIPYISGNGTFFLLTWL